MLILLAPGLIHPYFSNSMNSPLLFTAIEHIYNAVDYTYHFAMKRFPILDHFIWSDGLFDTAVTKLVSMHEVDNTSDHEPLLLGITVSHQRLALTSRRYRARPAWFTANTEDIDNYRANLVDNLRAVYLTYAAMLWCNVICCDSGHRQAMNNFAIEIS